MASVVPFGSLSENMGRGMPEYALSFGVFKIK